MQINNNSLSLSGAIGQTSAIDHHRSSRTPLTRDAGGDSLEFSSLASHLAADPEKLQQVRASYQNGTYRVPAAQTASSIINDALRAV